MAVREASNFRAIRSSARFVTGFNNFIQKRSFGLMLVAFFIVLVTSQVLLHLYVKQESGSDITSEDLDMRFLYFAQPFFANTLEKEKCIGMDIFNFEPWKKLTFTNGSFEEDLDYQSHDYHLRLGGVESAFPLSFLLVYLLGPTLRPELRHPHIGGVDRVAVAVMDSIPLLCKMMADIAMCWSLIACCLVALAGTLSDVDVFYLWESDSLFTLAIGLFEYLDLLQDPGQRLILHLFAYLCMLGGTYYLFRFAF